MNARRYGRLLIYALPALACVLGAPTAAVAASGSGGGGLSGGTGSSGTTTTVPTTPGMEPVSVSADGVTLQTTSSTLLRHALSFSGTAPGAAGETVEIEREGHATDGRWVATAETTVAADGTFGASWHPRQVGRFAMRATLLPSGATAATVSGTTTTPATAPSLTILVYRDSKATIYGPGFYGRRTACGPKLTRSTLGVANRTLPCGTRVSILFHGQELTVPVIDRGPYANGADWDLTIATAAALGIDGTEWLGTIALPAGAPDPSVLDAASTSLG